MSEFRNYRILNMDEIEKYFDNRSFAIPNLQRQFVWNARKAVDLADSIYLQFPIGMILVWQTKGSKELRKIRGILPPFDPEKNKHCLYLLDGQQRIGVIYRFYNPDYPERLVINERGQTIDFNQICFRVSESKFTYLKEAPDEKDHFSLSKILKGHYSHSRKISRSKREKLARVKRHFDDLQLPFRFIKNPSEDYVRDAFIRLNSKGTPLRAADKVLARACNIRLRDKINNFKERLQDIGFENIENSTITDTIVFCKGATDVSEGAKERKMKELDLKTQEFEEDWKKIAGSIGKAIDYFSKNFGVGHANILPSKTMIPVLSVFFNQNENRIPTNVQASEIRKWFWVSALASRYTGKSYRNIKHDIENMKELATTQRSLDLDFEKVEKNRLVTSDYSENSTIVKAYFCLLAMNEPLYLANGEKIELERPAVILDKKHKHHIFPRNVLVKNGFKARKYNSIINICYLALQENIGIQDKPPFEYLHSYRDTRMFEKIMESHLIPCNKRAAIWKKDIKVAFSGFLEERREKVAQSFENVAGKRIFER